jgi:hypothetical protein
MSISGLNGPCCGRAGRTQLLYTHAHKINNNCLHSELLFVTHNIEVNDTLVTSL